MTVVEGRPPVSVAGVEASEVARGLGVDVAVDVLAQADDVQVVLVTHSVPFIRLPRQSHVYVERTASGSLVQNLQPEQYMVTVGSETFDGGTTSVFVAVATYTNVTIEAHPLGDVA